jgi:8-oxo-dGTP diphosphatase
MERYLVVKRKVLAYITHNDRLLVFTHPYEPAAGIQVPAGTVEDGETLDDAMLREAWEETGLEGLRLARYLGETQRDLSDYGKAEIHHRHFYHLVYEGDPPETWRHEELFPSEGLAASHTFEFFWATLPDGVPSLVADHDQMLPVLLAHPDT